MSLFRCARLNNKRHHSLKPTRFISPSVTCFLKHRFCQIVGNKYYKDVFKHFDIFNHLVIQRNFTKYNMSLFKNIKNIYLDSLEDSSEVLVNVGMQLLLLVELYLQKSNIWKQFESVWKE